MVALQPLRPQVAPNVGTDDLNGTRTKCRRAAFTTGQTLPAMRVRVKVVILRHHCFAKLRPLALAIPKRKVLFAAQNSVAPDDMPAIVWASNAFQSFRLCI